MAGFFKKFREAQFPFCTALVPAAGSSNRMGCEGSKLLLTLEGVPVLVRSLQALQRARRVDEIIVAAREEDILPISELCRTYGLSKVKKVICGGETRTRSVLCAALEASPRTELLAVHDGARPLAQPALIDDVIEKAARCGAAAPAVPLKDTVKEIREDGSVIRTPEREALRAVQTPQVFAADLLKAALQSALDKELTLTDDCAAVERLGKRVYLTPGSEENIKITSPVDLRLAQAILAGREEA